MSKKEFLLTEDDARVQIDAFLDFYDFDPEDISESKTRSNVEQSIKSLVKQIRRGRVELSENGTAVQTLESGQTLSYKSLGGENKSAMKGDPEDFYGRLYSLIGSLTGVGQTAIKKLVGIDLSIAESIGVVFLQAV